jgi:hypothetical protein
MSKQLSPDGPSQGESRALKALNKTATHAAAPQLLAALKLAERALIPGPDASHKEIMQSYGGTSRPGYRAERAVIQTIAGVINAAEPFQPDALKLVAWTATDALGNGLRSSTFHVTGDGQRTLCNKAVARTWSSNREYSALPARDLLGKPPRVCGCCERRSGGMFTPAPAPAPAPDPAPRGPGLEDLIIGAATLNA